MSLILKNFLQNERALKRYLRRFFSRSQDIDDIAQETFLKAFVAESKTDVRSPKSFLFRVAKHAALDEIAKNSTEYNEDSDDSTVLQGRKVLQGIEHISVEQEYEGKQKLMVFSQAVASLPPNCRRVFLLRKMDGLKVKEIARKLDISVSGVEKHIATGLLKCSQYFRERGYDPAEFGAIGSKPSKKYAQGGIVKAVGTAFTVFLRNKAVEVTVTEGVVALFLPSEEAAMGEAVMGEAVMGEAMGIKVASLTPAAALTAGQNAVFTEEEVVSVSRMSDEALDRKLLWRGGFIAFAGESLATVVAEVSRYTDVVIEIDDPALEQLPIGGYFKVGEVEGMFEALEGSFGVSVERISPTRVKLSHPGTSPVSF